LVLVFAFPTRAQVTDSAASTFSSLNQDTALELKAPNPFSNIITVSIQSNYDYWSGGNRGFTGSKGAPEWDWRFTSTFLFPTAIKKNRFPNEMKTD
jgi:hypothetical protein